jgi:hypothetical protein
MAHAVLHDGGEREHVAARRDLGGDRRAVQRDGAHNRLRGAELHLLVTTTAMVPRASGRAAFDHSSGVKRPLSGEVIGALHS